MHTHRSPAPTAHPGSARRRAAGVAVALALLAPASAFSLAPASATLDKPAKAAKVAVSAVSLTPAVGAPGASVTVKATLRNRSRKTIKKAKVVLRLSQDAVLGSGDRTLVSTTVGRLEARAKKKVRVAMTVPADVAPGRWHVLACVATCRPTTFVVPQGPTTTPTVPDRGTLTGTLTFSRTRPYQDGQVVDMKADVNVAMRYEGPPERADELQSTGSTYTMTTDNLLDEVDGACRTMTKETGATTGTLLESADPYADEILAGVRLLDLSELSLTTFLRSTTTTTVTRTGDETCSVGMSTTSATGLHTTEMTLSEVSRTPSAITYRVSAFHDQMSTGSEWDRIDGTLTLHLG